jgi:hypothetical protein
MSRRVGGIFKAAGLLTGTTLVLAIGLWWYIRAGRKEEE